MDHFSLGNYWDELNDLPRVWKDVHWAFKEGNADALVVLLTTAREVRKDTHTLTHNTHTHTHTHTHRAREREREGEGEGEGGRERVSAGCPWTVVPDRWAS
jgi:hypothetical protein